MPFISKKRDENQNEEEGSHTMWSREIKKLLKKAGLC